MTRRAKGWWAVAVLFSAVNVAGAVYAALAGEPLHAGIHVALALLGAYPVWRLAPRRDAGRMSARGSPIATPSSELTDHLTNLEQAVDAVAIEVERIGEGQRFMTRAFSENAAQRPPDAGAAAPVERRVVDGDAGPQSPARQ